MVAPRWKDGGPPDEVVRDAGVRAATRYIAELGFVEAPRRVRFTVAELVLAVALGLVAGVVVVHRLRELGILR